MEKTRDILREVCNQYYVREQDLADIMIHASKDTCEHFCIEAIPITFLTIGLYRGEASKRQFQALANRLAEGDVDKMVEIVNAYWIECLHLAAAIKEGYYLKTYLESIA